MKLLKIGLFLVFVTVFVMFYKLGLSSYLSLDALKENRDHILLYYQAHKAVVISIYALIYVVSTACSLPGATILTLAGGAIFGSFIGTLVILVSATCGATLAFLSARFILRDSLEARYRETVMKFNDGIGANAWNFVLFLRLVPLFPFFLINLALGLTRVPISVFFLGSLAGMAPGTFVYVHAGSRLLTINSLKEIGSPQTLSAFALLGVLAVVPVFYKIFKRRKAKSAGQDGVVQ